jgi:hypothetical protein
MSEVRSWLEAIGLAQYADVFEAKRVGEESVYHLARLRCLRSGHSWQRSYHTRLTSAAHLG